MISPLEELWRLKLVSLLSRGKETKVSLGRSCDVRCARSGKEFLKAEGVVEDDNPWRVKTSFYPCLVVCSIKILPWQSPS
jgi:hypothetical protein